MADELRVRMVGTVCGLRVVEAVSEVVVTGSVGWRVSVSMDSCNVLRVEAG